MGFPNVIFDVLSEQTMVTSVMVLWQKVIVHFGAWVASANVVGGSENDESVSVTMSWNINGPRLGPETPWSYTSRIRFLRPYARKDAGKYANLKYLNLLPEITLLANDAPADSKTFFVRFIKDQIDIGMVRN